MKVLIADDDAVVRTLLRTVLERLEHHPDVVSDGAEAWRSYQQARHTLVLLDIDMPGMNGLDVCRRIREADPRRETFVIVVTGHDGPDDLTRVLDAGADDYITKPATPENLRARLSIAERRIEQNARQREAEQELQKARWLAGVGETSIALQHEINNPLSALLGHAELLLMDSEAKGEKNEQVEIIHAQAKRIADVVRRLRALRNPQSVSYVGDSKMLDLSERSPKPAT